MMTKYIVKVFVSQYKKIGDDYELVELNKTYTYHDADDVHGLIDYLMAGNSCNRFEITTKEVGDE